MRRPRLTPVPRTRQRPMLRLTLPRRVCRAQNRSRMSGQCCKLPKCSCGDASGGACASDTGEARALKQVDRLANEAAALLRQVLVAEAVPRGCRDSMCELRQLDEFDRLFGTLAERVPRMLGQRSSRRRGRGEREPESQRARTSEYFRGCRGAWAARAFA